VMPCAELEGQRERRKGGGCHRRWEREREEETELAYGTMSFERR